MYLGETLEEKKENYELLTRKAKKLGVFFGILGGLAGLIAGIGVMSAAEEKILAFFAGCIFIVFTPIMYYWAGYLWFYGFTTVKSWFVKLGIGVVGASSAVGSSIAVSYLIGGRKTAKITGIVWLIALAITLSIGFYVGLYNFFKIRTEVKRLGIV